MSKAKELTMENQNLIAIMAHAVETEYRQTDKAAGKHEESTPANTPTPEDFSWRKIWHKFTQEKSAASVDEPKHSTR